jgi:hypothetical protein
MQGERCCQARFKSSRPDFFSEKPIVVSGGGLFPWNQAILPVPQRFKRQRARPEVLFRCRNYRPLLVFSQLKQLLSGDLPNPLRSNRSDLSLYPAEFDAALD